MSYQQIIYNRLRQHGVTQAGALGILGNFDCESNCEPFRVQGDFDSSRRISKAYVQNVTNGTISRDSFARDGRGFGIYQLTYWSRKDGYWQFWKASGKALDSAELQVDYAVKEMKSDFPNLWRFLTQTSDVFTACSRVCREFERPAVNNIDARHAAANRIQKMIDLNNWDKSKPEPAPTPAPEPTPVIDHSLKLRTIDKHCESFTEFALLETLLKLRNYWNANGTWAGFIQFQKDNGLDPDGVCGPMSWRELLKL